MAKGKEVTIKTAKGRPMLNWVGKRALQSVKAFPAQLVEVYNPVASGYSKGKAPKLVPIDWSDWPSRFSKGGLLFHGDNKEVLGFLLASGFRKSVKLIYIDPPFDSNADYVRNVKLRGAAGSEKLAAEGYSVGEQIQYEDIWAQDSYLQFMYERLTLLYELLSEDGSLFLHCDWRRVHHLRCLLDEVFGSDRMINEIIWQHQIMGGAHDKRFPKGHETILWYSKSNDYRLNSEDSLVRVPFSQYVMDSMQQDENGHWYYERRRMSRKASVQEAKNKAHTRTFVDDPSKGTVAADVWNDMLSYQEKVNDRQGLDLFPTQKPTPLLKRIIAAASNPGEIVLDSFIGSGTTAVAAQLLGRRWIGCDINKGAIQNCSKRLQVTIMEQLEQSSVPIQQEIEGNNEIPMAIPACVQFTHWRVNDYDLQIQHNEAVELACQGIGVEKQKSDNFFDGTLGKQLVKVIPFQHPLSPLDLEDIKKELEARPEEDRAITVVCLGWELAAQSWLEDWNRLRKGKDAVNRINVIELRSDPKYGRWIAHQPAQAKVSAQRIPVSGDSQEQIRVTIEDFISPTILERLQVDSPLIKPQIDDWRCMVDCVMIDSAYNGEVFNIVLSDVPEKKSELVEGTYELAVPKDSAGAVLPATKMAVKIIDMLGEEVVVIIEV